MALLKAEKYLQKVNDETYIFVSNKINNHDIFDYFLNKFKTADKVFISSFAITDDYIRRFIKNTNYIKEITLLLDMTVATRKAHNTIFASKNVKNIYLANNHSKIILFDKNAICIMSNNTTKNTRYECGFISFNINIIDSYSVLINEMINNSIKYV